MFKPFLDTVSLITVYLEMFTMVYNGCPRYDIEIARIAVYICIIMSSIMDIIERG